MSNQPKNTKTFGCFGLGFALLGFLLCFIPFIGVAGLSFGFFGIIFSGIAFHLLKKENKSITMPIIGLSLGITSVCFGGYQYYQYKFVFDGISEVNKKKDDALWKLAKHFFIKEDKDVNNFLDEVNPDRHNEYFISFVENLRVREQPNLESKIIGHLKFGDKALSLKEESPNKYSIEIGGAMRFSNWKKVKFPGEYLGDTITGWAYGGALLAPSNKKFEATKDIHFKTIFKESSFDISKLIGLKIFEKYTYHGIIGFKEFYKKDGPFRLVGYSKKGVSDLHEFQNTLEIKGTFKNDRLDGLLTKEHILYESAEMIKIKFEKGKCTWFSIDQNSEGEKSYYEEKTHRDCSFEYIERSALEN